MKRVPAHKKPEYGIEKIKTWFKWIRCDVCGNEFRKEPIWKVFIFSDIKIWSNRFDHVCQGCAKSLEDVIKYRQNIRNKMTIPPAPPAPPPPMKIF
jgi:hypothetical protein